LTWRAFEHQADLGLEIDAADGPSLFREAARAYLAHACDVGAVRTVERYELAGEAKDVEELLVDWLNDLVFLVEGRQVVARDVELLEWEPIRYRAEALGEPLDPARHAPRGLVKAATYHGLRVYQDEDGWHARVILDV
jgi:SHS2 domain-containing protein